MYAVIKKVTEFDDCGFSHGEPEIIFSSNDYQKVAEKLQELKGQDTPEWEEYPNLWEIAEINIL